VLALARRQHGVVTRGQLFDLGMTSKAVAHRIRRGRLHPIHRGVYGVGRPDLTLEGRWMAAVLACGDGAALSHASAAELWAIRPGGRGRIEVTVPGGRCVQRTGVIVHRRLAGPVAPDRRRRGIPVTSPAQTLVDLAAVLTDAQLEAAVNEADKLDLVTPHRLLELVEGPATGRPAAARLRDLLREDVLTLTDSQLERLFLRIARTAGLPKPQTQAIVNGFRVDFFWPALGLVVETDGLRYHRTPIQQARDRRRDQAHAAAGLTPLRFTHAQVANQPRYVEGILRVWLRRAPSRPSAPPRRRG
jgi:very-short-patch-repair endonuclease